MVIVDTNTWCQVFDCASANHKDFASVRAFILTNKSAMAWGGTDYLKELCKAHKYMELHLELTKGGRAVRFNDKSIDAAASNAKAKCNHKNFNDSHIIGLQIVSKARVIVSHDKRSYPFLKRSDLYPKHHVRPKIYCKAQHSNLLGQL